MKDATDANPSAVARHIETVAALERQSLEQRSRGEQIGDVVSAHTGTMFMVVLHAALFAAWIVLNEGLVPGVRPFDPFPFGLLTLIVSLEAIFLSLFLLISQNRLTRQADRRAELDLQVNLLIETETTKMLVIMDRICRKLGIAYHQLVTHQPLELILFDFLRERAQRGRKIKRAASPRHAS